MTDRPAGTPGDGTVHLVVPAGVDDPTRPSGGNVYDRQLRDRLRALGWTVHQHDVAGGWPRPGAAGEQAVAGLLARLPDAATVLVDGLVGSAAPALVAAAARLRVVVLVHMALAEALPDPCAGALEGTVLRAAAAVVTPSHWARDWLVHRHALAPDRVHVATPGVDRGARVAGSRAGDRLLCVGAVTPDKGHDLLLAALAEVRDLDWRCVCVGALDLDPGFVTRLDAAATRWGLGDRLEFRGPLSPARLDALRSTTDLVVSASRRESYGMAVAEGLARAIPVVATAVGGHPEAVGRAADGTPPGLLVPVDDIGAFGGALRRWLTEPGTRQRLRAAAASRRTRQTGWDETASVVSQVLCAAEGDGDPLNRRPRAPVPITDGHETER